MKRRLLPLDAVAAVVIHEAVTTTSVSFYLAVALNLTQEEQLQPAESALVLPFPTLRPRLAELVAPYRAANAMLPQGRAPWPTPEIVEQLARAGPD